MPRPVRIATVKRFAKPVRRKAPEDAIQVEIVSWMRRNILPPPDGPYWTAINPKPFKSLTVAQQSKRMGMKSGVADLWLTWKGRAISVELKAKNGALSDSQRAFKREFTLAGGLYYHAKSLDDFKLFVEMTGIPRRAIEL